MDLHAAVHSHTHLLFDYSDVLHYHCFIKNKRPGFTVISNQYEKGFTQLHVVSVYD